MAQTQPQHISSPFSSPSPGAAGSPVNGGIPPPPKRPRLSPNPQSQSQSPYASPAFGTLNLPQNTPTANGTNVNGTAPVTVPPPAQPQPAGTMGPPSRPADKTTDAAELTDVLASSGIDVREEEAFLTSSYSGPGAQAQQPTRAVHAQLPPLTTSFASQTSVESASTATTGSFTGVPQVKSFSAQEPDHVETAVETPAPTPLKDTNEPTKEDTQAARRAQHHLQDPFLLTKVLEQKLQKRGLDLGVRIPSEGLFHPVPGRSQPIEATGPDGSSIVRTGQTILSQEGAPLVDILNLLSLSCEERLRSVVEYSTTLARSRRAHSHGTVPAEWREMAQPAGTTNGKAAGHKRKWIG